MVFVNVADPVETGLVTNWPRPDGNATGLTSWEFGIGAKWLQLLKEISPGSSHIMVLLNADNPSAKNHLQVLAKSAQNQSLDLTEARVTSPEQVPDAIRLFAIRPDGGMIVLPSGFTQTYRRIIIQSAAEFRLPAVYPYRYHAREGGLISFGTDPVDIFRRAADYLDRILRGAKPGDLAVLAPTKFELVINLNTAKALGLTVPILLLAQANELID